MVSVWHVGCTCGSGIVSSAADVSLPYHMIQIVFM